MSHDLDALLERRKRLLTEIFFLSKYAECPQEYAEGAGASGALVDSEDLAGFLAHNDLELGRVFDSSSLPSVYLEPVDAITKSELEKVELTDGSHATSSTLAPEPHINGTTQSGPEDCSKQDAEIAKASLLGVPVVSEERCKSAPNMDLTVPAISLTHHVRLKHAVVELPKLLVKSEFDVSQWLLKARASPLLALVQGARKTMSTEAWSAALIEQKWIKVSERIEELKQQNKWSLRQLTKQQTARRAKAHWDFLLDEMRWMRTDYREERKWKVALARKVAYAVREWHDALDKTTHTVRFQVVPRPLNHTDVEMKDISMDYEPPTPPSGNDDHAADRPRSHPMVSPYEPRPTDLVMVHSPPLSTIDDTTHVFEMPEDEIYACLSDNTGRTSPSLLPDMPIYGPPMPEDEAYEDFLDSAPVVSSSTYTQTPIRVKRSKKRGRNELEEIVANLKSDVEHPMLQHSRRKSTQLALTVRPPFVPNNVDQRSIDRKDHQIVWTPDADDMLLSLLAEYQYNWDFVAQAMTPSSSMCSVADRKSAWDCFERWIQIDPRSGDVIFTGPQARLVQARVDDMVRTPKIVDKVAMRRASSSHKVLQSDLKKQRQFSVFDAMRKVQRKRENQPKVTQPKKVIPTDPNKTPPVVPTPQHLSQMKFERDQQIARAFLESKNQQMQALQQQRLMQQQQQKGGAPPTQAQIAQIQAARQTQHRAQLAQQAAQAAASGMIPNGVPSGVANGQLTGPHNGHPNGQLNGQHNGQLNGQLSGRMQVSAPRPPVTGQMPSRPSSANGMPNSPGIGQSGQVPNPALLRIPPGQRLSQEQMNQLLAQARLQRGISATPPPGPGVQLNGRVGPTNGHNTGTIGIPPSPSPSTPLGQRQMPMTQAQLHQAQLLRGPAPQAQAQITSPSPGPASVPSQLHSQPQPHSQPKPQAKVQKLSPQPPVQSTSPVSTQSQSQPLVQKPTAQPQAQTTSHPSTNINPQSPAPPLQSQLQRQNSSQNQNQNQIKVPAQLPSKHVGPPVLAPPSASTPISSSIATPASGSAAASASVSAAASAAASTSAFTQTPVVAVPPAPAQASAAAAAPTVVASQTQNQNAVQTQPHVSPPS